jgi:pilus assembly protein CpaF
VDLIVQQSRFPDGSRKITSLAEVSGIDDNGRVELNEIFRYLPGGRGEPGLFLATGWLPAWERSGPEQASRKKDDR